MIRASWQSSLVGACVLSSTTIASAQSAVSGTSSGASTSTGAIDKPPIVHLELAGKPLARFPYFQCVRAVDEGAPLWIAVDPVRHRSVQGQTCLAYLVRAKSAQQWTADPSLVDVRGAPQFCSFSGSTIRDCTFQVDFGTLSGDNGSAFGVAYDVVLDFDQDGQLSPGDFIDGGASEAGFYVVRDPGQTGPVAVSESLYSGGSFLGQDLFYPTAISTFDTVPLVIVSHGNGQLYTWYDHIGKHLASWGFVVMSHENNTAPGPEAASVTTLSNTEYFLSHLSTIAGGALKGHIDTHHIMWLGQSRGGEGVVRAYDKLRTGAYMPLNFAVGDIALVSAIAPTEFLPSSSIDPFDVPFHMFVGAADTDVTGDPSSGIVQSMPIYERSKGNKHLFILQGAGHADFHDGGGFCWCTGPNLIGASATHQVEFGYYLPLAERYLSGNIPARDYFERMYADFHSPSIPSSVVVASESSAAAGSGNFVIDDFQTHTATNTSSSGQPVTFDVTNLSEGLMKDVDGSFVFGTNFPMNGMTRWLDSGDSPRCAVFDWNPALGQRKYEFDLAPSVHDLTQFDALAFRAAQGTRHPETDTLDAPLSFGVALIDESGVQSTIEFSQYGKLTRPYERTGFGAGAGWANEFSSVRIRLEDFTHDTPSLALDHIAKVRLVFGGKYGSSRGRVALDDLCLVAKGN